MAQTVGATTTNYALDVALGLAEVIFTSEGQHYLHLPGVILTQAQSQTRYLLGDGLGSIRQATDELGQVVATASYDPYGNPLGGQDSGYGYTGEPWLAELGLLHLRARWYDPNTGTFLSRDSVESEPPYMYVHGNPVNFTDSSGYRGGPDDLLATCLESLPCRAAMYEGGAAVAVVAGPEIGVVVLTVSGLTLICTYLECSPAPNYPYIPSPAPEPMPEPRLATPVPPQLPLAPPISDLYPYPQPDPQPDPQHPPTPTCTSTPEPEVHISLSTQSEENNSIPNLYAFTGQLNGRLNPKAFVYAFYDWQNNGIATSIFPDSFDQATQNPKVKTIHFNLFGRDGNKKLIGDPNQFIRDWGGNGVFYSSHSTVTGVELYRIQNQGLCGKTKFYRLSPTVGGSINELLARGTYVESMSDWVEICSATQQ